MTDIQPFTHEQFGTIRTITDASGEAWFVATDICAALDLSNTTVALQRLDADERSKFNLGRQGDAWCVNEAGFYSLVLASRKPEAKSFKRWVTHEVLPSIRKHGGYLTPEKAEEIISNPDVIIELAQAVKREKAARLAMESLVHELEPKADMYDRFLGADGTYSIGNVAKMVGLSQNKLFDRLRNSGVLIAKGAMRNTPYQRYMHHFSVHPYDFERSDGTRGTSYTTRVQPSGIQFICRKLNCHLITEEAA
ncbi:MAG: phage antirepressor KilAC domain-containing protein [Cutibacterium avidum]|nr:phage antirepressor KilAC domain-containing protein [Cutibacterium avidum]MDU5418766.1 phage antirepressor KilAC domain-containing protein [Cutibacterium avidum]